MKSIFVSIFFFILLLNSSYAQVSTDSLLLDLPFDGNANDMSGNNNNGIVYKAVLCPDRFGNPNSAYLFNGVDSYIEIPSSSSMERIERDSKISISAWININQWYNAWNVFSIFERYNAVADAGWSFEANWASGGILWLANEDVNTNYVGCNYSWSFHQWHHAVLTYDYSQGIANFYVDCNLICSKAYSSAIYLTDNAGPYDIGRSLAGPDEWSDGVIDDVKVYNRILTAAEVTLLCNAGTTNVKEVNKKEEVSVFPNPLTSLSTLHFTTQLKDAEVIIYDMVGKEIMRTRFSGNKMEIDSRALGMDKGIYFVKVRAEDRQWVEKIVVE